MEQNINIEKIDQTAAELADETIADFKESPDDLAAHNLSLYDLAIKTAKKAAALAATRNDDKLANAVAGVMPPYEAISFYRSRTSFLALSLAVLAGWLLGGILSTLLGFMQLGGEIIRPVAILCAIWLEDYLGSNPKARHIMLSVLGLGALGRFAAAIGTGLVRFTNFASLRSLIFGSATKVNFFKSLWLWLGAIFLIAFFAKKNTGMDLPAFRENLKQQITQRLILSTFIFENIDERDTRIADLEKRLESNAKGNASTDMRLAQPLVSLLDRVDDNTRRYIESEISLAGFQIPNLHKSELIWQEDACRELYDTLGIVNEGDPCKILREPIKNKVNVVKGLVQRMSQAKI